MSNQRHSFGGRPPRHPYHPNQRPRGDGPEFNQQAGFFRPHPTNGPGPRNHGETGNPWHINRNRNMNGGRWENAHRGQRRGPRHNNGQENYRPGNNHFYGGPAADQNHQRLPPRPSQNQGQSHFQGRNAGFQPHPLPGGVNNQTPPFQQQGYNGNQNPQPPFMDNNQRPKGRWRGGRRNNRNQQIPLEPSSPSAESTGDSLSLSDIPEQQPQQYWVPQFGIPPCGFDRDGDVEMTEAPPLDEEIIRLLKEGTIALHEVTTIMIEYAKHYG